MIEFLLFFAKDILPDELLEKSSSWALEDLFTGDSDFLMEFLLLIFLIKIVAKLKVDIYFIYELKIKIFNL
jgi:hypothetical protein